MRSQLPHKRLWREGRAADCSWAFRVGDASTGYIQAPQRIEYSFTMRGGDRAFSMVMDGMDGMGRRWGDVGVESRRRRAPEG